MLIRSATVIDGTGAPPRTADVLVRHGRIDTVSPGPIPALSSDSVVDADGLVLSPGFIDIHTHSDVSLYLDGRGESKIQQGVTTEVIGNCGFSAFPITPDHRVDQLDLLEGIGDPRIEPTWTDLDGYAVALEERGIAVNVAPLVGHGALRLAVAGTADGPLGATELAAAAGLLSDLLDQGAFGLSTGLTYVPSRFADTAELVALCRVLADRGALYATHARGDGARSIAELVTLATETGVRAQYSHFAINDPARWGTAAEIVSLVDDARRTGADIAGDVYPYAASASALTQYLPVWVQDGGMEAMRTRLTDQEAFGRAAADLATGWGSSHGGGRIAWEWDRVQVSRADGIAGVRDGETIRQAATRLAADPAELVLTLCREGGHRVQVVLHYRTEQDMQTFLAAPWVTMGSDGSAVPYNVDRLPHPRFFGASARVLGRYVREVGLFDLPQAVHKMTGAVADRLGITDRGVVRAGAVADLVLLDPGVIADRASFTDPAQPPDGIRAVWVNGELAVDRGTQTSARAGRVLRRS